MGARIHDLIKLSQGGDKNSLKILIDEFGPQIKRHAVRLGRKNIEDTRSEMTLSLICIVKKIRLDNMKHADDATLRSYINKSLQNAFMSLAISERSWAKMTPLSNFDYMDGDGNMLESLFGVSDSYDNLEYMFLKQVLKPREADIAYYCFILKYPSEQVAKHFHISRETVERNKSKALKKLRDCLP